MAPVHKTSEDAIDKLDRRRRAPPHIILHTLPAFSFSTPTHSIRIQFAYQTPPARANPARTKMAAVVAENAVNAAERPRSTDTFGKTYTAEEINHYVNELRHASQLHTSAIETLEGETRRAAERLTAVETTLQSLEDTVKGLNKLVNKRVGDLEKRSKKMEESLNNKLDTETFLESMNVITAMLSELGSPSARARGMPSPTTLPRLRTEVTPNPGLLSPDALLSPHRSPTTSDPPSPSSPSASRPLRRKKSFIEKAVNFITRRVTANVSANYQPPPGFEDQLARELNEAITFVEVHGPPEPDTEALPPVPPLPASVSRDNLVVGSRRGPQSPTTAKGKGKGKERER